MLHRLRSRRGRLAELDAVIAIEACQPWAHQLELLQTIPGVGPKVAQVIIAETGGDMSRFPTAAHLAAWAGLAPAMNESAGKRSPAGTRHGNKWLDLDAGRSGRLSRADEGTTTSPPSTPASPPRRGMRRAQVAVAHSILVSAYYMLTRDEPYRDLGPDWLAITTTPSPHPPPGRPTRTPRPHRRPRPSQLAAIDTDIRAAPGCCRLPAQSHSRVSPGKSSAFGRERLHDGCTFSTVRRSRPYFAGFLVHIPRRRCFEGSCGMAGSRSVQARARLRERLVAQEAALSAASRSVAGVEAAKSRQRALVEQGERLVAAAEFDIPCRGGGACARSGLGAVRRLGVGRQAGSRAEGRRRSLQRPRCSAARSGQPFVGPATHQSPTSVITS